MEHECRPDLPALGRALVDAIADGPPGLVPERYAPRPPAQEPSLVERLEASVSYVGTEQQPGRVWANFSIPLETWNEVRAALTAAPRPPAPEALREYVQHKSGCRKLDGFGFSRRNNCERCFGTGHVPSEDCDDCPDCQTTCPECGGKLPPAQCTCGLEALLSAGGASAEQEP